MPNQTSELIYDVDVKVSLDNIRKTGIIEDQAIDSSVNKNRWQVPDEDLDHFASTLKDAQVRINHGEKGEAIKGLVIKTKHSRRWRVTTLAQLRRLILEADPDITEE